MALIACLTSAAGCATGYGRTGAAPRALAGYSTRAYENAADQRDVPEGKVRVQYTGAIFAPNDSDGFRFGLNGGFKLGLGMGSLAGYPKASGLYAEGYGELMLAYSRFSLTLGGGEVSEDMDYAGHWTMQMNSYLGFAQFGVALADCLSLHVGGGVLAGTSLKIAAAQLAQSTGPDGARGTLGLNWLIVQTWWANLGVRLEVGYARSSASLPNARPIAYEALSATGQIYVTFF